MNGYNPEVMAKATERAIIRQLKTTNNENHPEPEELEEDGHISAVQDAMKEQAKTDKVLGRKYAVMQEIHDLRQFAGIKWDMQQLNLFNKLFTLQGMRTRAIKMGDKEMEQCITEVFKALNPPWIRVKP